MPAESNSSVSAARSRPVPWWVRKAHRWIGLAMAIQFLAWTVSGFYFALFPIEEIRGSHLVDAATVLQARDAATVSGMEGILAGLDEPDAAIEALSLNAGVRGPYWTIVHDHGAHHVDAVTGVELDNLTAAQARTLAETLVGRPPARTQWVTSAASGSEYRGRPLPAWRLEFEQPEKLHLYLHGQTGEVTAARTQRWRIFDFLWMLHILDFEDRTDFNTWLLKIMAALGIVTVISGFLLWLVSTRRFGLGRRNQESAA